MARKNWDRKKQIEDAVKRIFKKKLVSSSGCWIFTGGLSWNGYGRISMANERHARPHRIIWESINGKIDSNLDVCHRCDVRNCFNPSHLFLGTRKENMQDAVKKGRTQRGQTHSKAKLSNFEVLEIRSFKNIVSQRILSEAYGVKQGIISMIQNKKIWRHI